MTLRANPFRALPILMAFLLNVLIGPLAPMTQLATQPVLALSGSSFNATDGNLTDDTGPETDWCTPAPNLVIGTDSPSGSNDTSFASNNNKEDSNVPTLATGTIPNNKDDLLREYVASETVGDDLFVYLAWIRADSTGTSTIDFEFNQSDQLSSNGVTKLRTDGDLLVTFDFQANPGSQGGYSVELTLRTWDNDASDQPDPTSSPANTGKWVNPVDLIENDLAEGAVNDDTVIDCLANPEVDLPVATFGEAVLNLSDILGGDCEAFGSIFTKSRSSNSFSADLKDRINPLPVDLSTCGQITILKDDENGDPLGGATFTVTPNPFTGSGSLDVTDNQAPDDDDAAGVIHLSGVEPDEYEVCEKTAPAGYIKDSHCETLTVDQNGSAQFGPWENGLGDISWEKRDEQSDKLIGGATFTLEGTAGAADGFGPITVVDNGPIDADGDDGEFLVVDLLLGTYLITETVPPTGYDLPADVDQEVVLSGQTASAAVAFEDPPRRDPSVEKTAELDPVVAGHDASFNIVVTAGGYGDSENVELSDDNPADSGKTWTVSGADSGDCADLSIAPGESLSCDFGTIDNGDSRTVKITMTALQSDCENGIDNTATITADDDVDLTNNTSSDSISVLCPNPGVVKTADADPIIAGAPASFTVLVTAGGSGDAENVVLTDENESNNTWSVSGADAGACDSDSVAPGETVTCDFGTILEGGTRTIKITATTTPDDCEEGIANTATITADDDVDTSNNEDGDHITVVCPDPSVEKTTNVAPIDAGDPASFTIEVTAGGSGDSENVALTDTNETDHTWTVSGANAAACDSLSVAPGEDLICDFGTIPEGQSRTVTITMTSEVEDCEEGIANTATITADADVDLSNNEDSDHITVECPALTPEKVADGSGVVSAGQEIGFTITIANSNDPGTGTAKNVEIDDPLPAGDGLDWSESPDNADCDITGVPGAQTLECSFGDLEPGDSVSVHLVSDTSELDCATFHNVATVTADNHATLEPSDDVTVECPGLNILKRQVDANGEPTTESVVAGETAYFEVIVWNIGPGTVLNATFHDELPSDVEWSLDLLNPDGDDSCGVASSVIPGQPEEWSADCSFGDLPPSSMEDGKHLIFSGETDGEDCGLLENFASAKGDNNDQVEADASLTVRCPTLVIDKAADTEAVHFVFDADGNVLSVEPEQVTWTLTYTLTDGPVSGAFISDPLPEFLVFVSASDGGAYDPATRIISWDLGDLTVDGSDSVSFVTTVDPDAPEPGPIVNVATIDSNETAPDDGEDSIIVTSESELGGNPTPKPSVPDTAVVFGPAGEPVSIPVELLAFILIGSLGTLAFANVRATRRRR